MVLVDDIAATQIINEVVRDVCRQREFKMSSLEAAISQPLLAEPETAIYTSFCYV